MAGDLTIGVKLVADSSGVVRGMRLTEAELERLAQRIRRASDDTRRANNQFDALQGTLNKLTGALGAVGLGFSAGAIAKYVIDTADAYKNLEGRLKLVTTSAANLADVEAKLFAVAQNTSSVYADTAQLYATLVRSTKSLGLSQADLITLTKEINESYVVSGASAQEASASTRQLSQALASGVLRGDEFNSVLENSPRLAHALSDALGLTVGQLRQLSQQGKLTTAVVLPALLSQAGKVDAEFRTLGDTAGRAMTRLVNSVNQAIGKADLTPLTGAIDDLRKTLSDPQTMQNLVQFASYAIKFAAKMAESVKYLNQVIESLTTVPSNSPEWLVKSYQQQLAMLHPGENPARQQQLRDEIAGLQRYIALKKSLQATNTDSIHIPITYQAQNLLTGGAGKGGGKKVTPFQDPADAIFDQLQYKLYFSDADALAAKQQAAVDRIRESIQTPRQKIAEEMKAAVVLHQQGALSDDDFLQYISKENEALGKLNDKSSTFADTLKQTLDPMQALQDAAGNMTSTFIEGLTDAITSGKSFGKVLENITKQIGEMIIKLTIEFAIREAMQALLFAANGAAFGSGGARMFANGGVVTSPTPFRYSGGLGVMGESGPEAVMPLKNIGGKLGVRAEMSGLAPQVIVNDHRGANAPPVEVSQRQAANGRQMVEVTIRDTVERLTNSGQLDTVFAKNFGLKRNGKY